MILDELMYKQASGRIRKIKIAVVLFGSLALICLVGMIFSHKSTLKKSEGELVSRSVKVTYMRGSRRSGSKQYFSTTTLGLKGSSKKFVIRESGERSSFLDSIQVGDMIKLYSKTWVQVLSGAFGTGNTFVVEKNGVVLFDDVKELRERGVFFLIASSIAAICGLIFYKMELRKARRLRDWQGWRSGGGLKESDQEGH